MNFTAGTLDYQRLSGEHVSLHVADHTQASLFETLPGELKKDVLAEALASAVWSTEGFRGIVVLSLDAPSGVDTTTGTVFNPAVRATATMTFALPKKGLRASGVDEQVGELYLADIGVPPELYAAPALGLDVPHIFAAADIVRLI